MFSASATYPLKCEGVNIGNFYILKRETTSGSNLENIVFRLGVRRPFLRSAVLQMRWLFNKTGGEFQGNEFVFEEIACQAIRREGESEGSYGRSMAAVYAQIIFENAALEASRKRYFAVARA
jgi:hypothetical protein